MGFILGLPTTKKGRDFTIVVVNRFSKMVHVIPWHKVDGASLNAKLFFKKVIRLHGIPSTIVSDMDTKFLSQLRRTLWGKLGAKFLYSTTRYPQTNGQTKVVNRTLGQMLRYMSFWNVKYQ